jgi:methylenetetrahydrofolate reductase (NADPH)
MKHDSDLAKRIEAGDFVVTAEFLPNASADGSSAKITIDSANGLTAVNVADNPHGPVMSSLAGAIILKNAGIEPVYQIITRDRNRIAIQSDLLGAAGLGIRNVLCLSGHHQALTGSPDSSNVYDMDSVQLIAAVRQMRDQGVLLDGTKIESDFTMLIGAVANPYMNPLELNIIRLAKKVEAGAEFIQTQAVFDVEGFKQWIEAAQKEAIPDKTAIIAGVLPFKSAVEAKDMRDKYMDMSIPDQVIERMNAAGDEEAQKKEGISICLEVIKEIKGLDGVKGIHILSGGRESSVPEIMAESGL